MDNVDLEAQRERAFDENHVVYLGFIGVSCSILQTLDRPFEAHRRKVVALSVVILTYFSLLWARSVLQTNGRNHVIVSKLISLFGALGVILPTLITVQPVGWLALGMCICFFVIDVRNSYSQIRDEFLNAVEEIKTVMSNSYSQIRDEVLNAVEEIKTVMNTLRNGNTIEQQVDGMPVENQHQ